MRVLGELIVVLGVGLAAVWFTLRRFVMPELHRRRQERLIEENARLDEQLRRMKGDQ